MKKELQDKLFKKYPALFRQKDLSPQDTAMCWGISCGDGWYDLLEALCGNIDNRLQNVNRNKPDNEKLTCEAVQVKEKFGGLCFYICGGDDYIDGLIDMAESMSYRLCTLCGNRMVENSNSRGWIYTVCDPCKETNEK